MHEFIYTQAKENILSSSIGCFMKGTLVKIPGGWKPIDELKVGDLVMSRPENGIGEAVAKKVVNTFRFENKEIWHVGISDDDLRRGFSTYEFAVTPNHPFCVYGVATNLYFPDNPELTHEWEQFSVQQYEEYSYDDYYDDETGEQILYSALHTYMQDEDTEEFKAFRSSPYEITLFDTPVWKRADQLEWGDVLLGTFNNYCVVELSRPYAAVPGSEWAWLADDKRRVTWQKEPLGHYIEFNLDSERFYKPAKVKGKDGFLFYTRNDEGLIRQDADGTRHYLPYLATVYNIEVEDYHTYCVGYEGFLVHNDNCGISRRNRVNLETGMVF